MTRRVLIVSSVRWAFMWQRHHAVARAAAERGWEVDFLEPRPRSLRQVAVGLRRALSGRGPDTVGRAPEVDGVRVMAWHRLLRLRPGYDGVLVYLPGRVTERLLRRAAPRWIVYDAVLDWSSVPARFHPPRDWRGSEGRICADPRTGVTVDSPGMAERLRSRGIESTVVEPAVDDEFTAVGRAFSERSDRAVYFGTVGPATDAGVLVALGRAGVGVDVIGHVPDEKVAHALRAAGCTLHAPVPIAELAGLVSTYKVALLPYTGGRVDHLVPAKLWNCLAGGGWVVSSGLRLDHVSAPNLRASDGDEDVTVELVRELMAGPAPRPGRVPTWSDRWEEILGSVPAHAGGPAPRRDAP